MSIRFAKILLLATIALWISLVVVGNLSDYGTNLLFVRHVLNMDTIFPHAHVHQRAIHWRLLHYAVYTLIVASEMLIAVACWLGAWCLWRVRHGSADVFRRAKRTAVLGLTVGVMLWLGVFVAIAGEWFGMWMSKQWNGIQSAFRFTIVLLVMLVWLTQSEDEPDN